MEFWAHGLAWLVSCLPWVYSCFAQPQKKKKNILKWTCAIFSICRPKFDERALDPENLRLPRY